MSRIIISLLSTIFLLAFVPLAGATTGPIVPGSAAIDGVGQIGDSITCNLVYDDIDSWMNADAYYFEWLRNGVLIDGATDQQYFLWDEDYGQMISCRVTAANEDTIASADSPEIGPITAPPVVPGNVILYGDAIVGTLLYCQTESWWDGVLDFSAYEYAWLRDGNIVPGQDSMQYLIQNDDIGAEIACRITGSNIGHSAYNDSAPVGPIPPLIPVDIGAEFLPATLTLENDMPTNITVRVTNHSNEFTSPFGQVAGYFSGINPIARDDIEISVPSLPFCQTIEAATGGGVNNSMIGFVCSFAPLAPGEYADFEVTITQRTHQTYHVNMWLQMPGAGYTDPDMTNNSATLLINSVTMPLLASQVAPLITGTTVAGSDLRCHVGIWTGNAPVYTIQWLRDGAEVDGATQETLSLTETDVNTSFSCRVTATDPSGSLVATSNSVGPVSLPLPPTPPIETAPPAQPQPLPKVPNDGCTIRGTDGDDVLRGTPGRDVICGYGGNDLILGLGGNDVLIGGAGNDTIFGGAGNDRIVGGAGNDVIDGGPGHDVLFGAAGNDIIRGGAGNDRISGGAGNDTIYGGAGSDRIFGGAGNDIIFGQAGNDVLFGQAGNDRLSGGPGNDVLSGGPGKDRLFGGPGKNRFYDQR